MNTGIAQLIALTTQGNWALHQSAAPGSLPLDSSTLFRHVEHLAFELHAAPGGSAPTPSAWFTSLRQRGVTRLWLVRLSTAPDSPLKGYDRTAFVNGEQLVIAAVLADNAMELWTPQWFALTEAGKKAWALRYRGYGGGTWFTTWAGASLVDATVRLRQVLKEISAFSSANGLESWTRHFDDALELLDRDFAGDQMEMLPTTGYPAPARRLLTAALAGWVFGGMGSWNDSGPNSSEAMPRYEALTAALFEAIMDAIVSAANAFDPVYL